MKLSVALVAALALPFMAGCPERKDMVEQVGGAPQQQVDYAKERLDASAAKAQANLDTAAKTIE